MATLTIDVKDFSNRFQELLSAAESGTEIIIEQEGEPRRAKLEILTPVANPVQKKRIAGLGAGRGGWMAPDFDEPLPDSFWLSEE